MTSITFHCFFSRDQFLRWRMEVYPLKRRGLSLGWPSMTTRLVWRVSTGKKSTRSSWKPPRYFRQFIQTYLYISEWTIRKLKFYHSHALRMVEFHLLLVQRRQIDDCNRAEGFFVIVLVSIQGSKFYENELKREQQVNQRIQKMMLQKEQITEQQLKKAQVQVRRVKSVGCYKTNISLNSLSFLNLCLRWRGWLQSWKRAVI